MKKLTFLLAATIILGGCVSPNMLPKSAAEVNYSAVGMVKGSGWHDGAIYEATEAEIITAVRAALLINGFKIQEFSRENRRFTAENPMTLYTWTSHLGVYYRPYSDRKVEVHVVALSDKDVNILVGDSQSPIPPKIIASIYSSLSRR